MNEMTKEEFEAHSKELSARAKEIHNELGLPNNHTVIAICTILASCEMKELVSVTSRVYDDSEMRVKLHRILNGDEGPDISLNSALITLLHLSLYDLGEENTEPSPERVEKLSEILTHGSLILQEGFQKHVREAGAA